MWKRRRRSSPTGELGELDPFLLSFVARLAAARRAEAAGSGEWVPIDQVAALCRQMTQAAVSALNRGWVEEAEGRMLVE
jgi:hypothetical protein